MIRLAGVLSLLLIVGLAAEAQAGDRFFVITDSHGVGRFGQDIAADLRARSETRFEFWASGASAPLQWINGAFYTPCGYHESSEAPAEPRRCIGHFYTPRLSDLLKAAGPKPDGERRIAVIVQGTNYGANPADEADQVRWTVTLLKDAQAGTDRCLWVGPPEMPHFGDANVQYKLGLIRKAIERAAAETHRDPCQLIDSRSYAHYPKAADPQHETPDGVHYHLPSSYWRFPEGEVAARSWAAGVWSEAEQLLSR